MSGWMSFARRVGSPGLGGLALALACVTALAPGCMRSLDAITVLEPVDVVTGWYDDGILADGKNKLVPTITLKFRNKSPDAVASIYVNAVFRRVGEEDMWGEHYGWAVPTQPLAPGAETPVLVMRSALGYTGVQPRMQMLQNQEFIDAKVHVFLRHGSKTWAKLAEYPIQRQLLTR